MNALITVLKHLACEDRSLAHRLLPDLGKTASIIRGLLVALMAFLVICPNALADCASPAPASPVTSTDENTLPDARQLVDGAGTSVDLTTPGQIKVSLPTTGVTAGSFTNPSLTLDAYGRVTAASNGASGAVIDGRVYINQPDGFGSNTRDVVGGSAGTYTGTLSNSAVVSKYLTNRVTTSATSGSTGSIVASEPITAFALKPIWTCALSPHTVSSVRYWIGLFDSSLAGSDTPTANFAAFRASTSASDSHFKFVTGDNTGSVTVTDTGVSFTADTPHEFKIDMSGYPSSISASIDGVVVATNTTHLPGSSTQFSQAPLVQTLTSSAAAADIGFIACSSEGVSGGGAIVTSVSNSDGTISVSPNVGAVSLSIPSNVALPGSPTTTTQSPLDNSTKIATTAYVDSAVSGVVPSANRHVAVLQPQVQSGSVYAYGGPPAGLGTSGSSTTISGLTMAPYTTGSSSGNDAFQAYSTTVTSLSLNPICSCPAALSTISNTRSWIGFDNLSDPGGTDTPTNVVKFRYSTNAGDADWMAYVDNGGTHTIVDTGVAPVANAANTFKIDCTNPASLKFYIDGMLVATITTNIPSTTLPMNFAAEIVTLTSSSETIYVGRMYVEHN